MTPRGQVVLASFSRKQKQILPLLAEGFSNVTIAEQLLTTEQTIKNGVGRMLEKSGTDNRFHLIMWCIYHGILPCPCSARAEKMAVA